MNAIAAGVAYTLAGIAKTFLSRKVIEYIVFSMLDWLVKRTETKYDDNLLDLVKREYKSGDIKI
jgi:type III secretory pathway component EscU